MSDDAPNSDEGASPADDIKKQNPGGTTTGDQTGETGGDHKVDDLAKAGRDGMDTDDDQVAEGKWKSTSDGSGTSETD
jgi:hypothetical protein